MRARPGRWLETEGLDLEELQALGTEVFAALDREKQAERLRKWHEQWHPWRFEGPWKPPIQRLLW